MKQLKVAMILLLLGTIVQAQTKQAQLNTHKKKVSYSIGLDIGKNFKQQSVDVDADVLAKGLKDALSGAKPMLSDSEIEQTMQKFQAEMMGKQEESSRKVAEKNKKEGQAFLDENKKKEGVVTLPSGLQYKILKEGTGPKPKKESSIVCHYRGTLLDGKEFDSSYKRGEPITYDVNKFIPGWVEALQLMPVGSKWQLFIPSNLAYGDRGSGNDIGPGATLIFELELIAIK
ncbi:MAG: FKBP-type peptidyl-prolyl cis-trans isomerase [Bacteroidota bacterium]